MEDVVHRSACSTPHLQSEFQASQESSRALAELDEPLVRQVADLDGAHLQLKWVQREGL